METKELSKKIISGFLSLTFRRIALTAISFATINLFLARILPVEVIGIFNIAASILSFFTFFSDVGLGAAIIQKKEITQDDLKTTFTIQQGLALLLVVLIWFGAPFLASLYHLDEGGMWLIRALGVGFFFSSLKVLPAVLLERNLKFHPLVLVEILETIVFNALLIYLSTQNYGVAAFSWAALVRGLVGVGAIYVLAPWNVKLGVSRVSAKTLLNFGVPFQLNSILAMMKDRLVPLVIAQLVGPLGVGYITWAQNLAFLPLEVMNIVIRITFPAFSRLQDDPGSLRVTVEKSLFLTGLFLYPALFGLLALAPSLVEHVVSSKWQPALPMVYLFSLATLWATISTPFTNVLNAIGKIKTTLKLMVMWTVLTWVLSPILTLSYGFVGVGISSALISFSSVIPVMIIKKELEVEVIKNIWQPLLSSALMAIPVYFLSQVFVSSLPSLIIVTFVGVVIYLLIMVLLAKSKIGQFIGELRHAYC